ncbi:MAG: hypothetical protein KF814_13625 [Nitrospiraceae bacterium]|nr:hypothetical protein [Nitrospiraceae bacterium]
MADMHAAERLTHDALAAVKVGDWDLVDRCYAERGICLTTMPMDANLAAKLLALDGEVRNAAVVAQTAILSLLSEAGKTRQHLRRLKIAQSPAADQGVGIHLKA